MELNILPEASPILHEACERFNFDTPQLDAKDFAESLYTLMVKCDGLGLSANQVGHKVQAFAIRIDDDSPTVLFNPKVVDRSDKFINMKEGCLSYPLLFLNIGRPDSVRIRFQDYTGVMQTKQFIGLSARVALHELDHLQGVTYTHRDVVSSFELNRAMRKRMILKRKVKK